MKKIINSLKKQSKIIISFMVGLIVATTVSYGVNSITSEGVSYKKSDGTTVSVKQALDELISKAATLNSENEQLKEKAEIYKYAYLSDVVAVGDYVAYDAGSWTETVAKPTSRGQFGGYTKDKNKANTVSACENRYGATTLKGWRVYSINANTKTVTLIHAGQPECYYHADSGYIDTSITNLNNRATSTYLNSSYADSAHMMNRDEALAITENTSETDNNLRKTGATYWLASADGTYGLWDVYNNGAIKDGSNFGFSFGVRPVVVLKSNILTTGLGTDKVGQEAWTLVKP